MLFGVGLVLPEGSGDWSLMSNPVMLTRDGLYFWSMLFSVEWVGVDLGI